MYLVGFINKFQIFKLIFLVFAVGILDVSNRSQLQNLFMQYSEVSVDPFVAVSSVVVID